MASKVNEVICRQFGLARHKVDGRMGGRTDADEQTVAYSRCCAADGARAVLHYEGHYRRQNIGRSTIGEGNRGGNG